MGLFSSSKSKLKIPGFVTESADFITDLLKQGTPNIPERQIAGLSDAEQQTQALLAEFLGQAGTDQPLGPDFATAKEAIRARVEGINLAETEGFKATIDKLLTAENKELNRLGRSLNIRGARSSSAGRDVLGRQLDAGTTNISAALFPFLFEEFQGRSAAAPLLANLATTEQTLPLQVGSQFGQLPRAIEQDRLDASFNQMMQSILFPTSTLAPLASSLVSGGGQFSQITGGDPSLFSQFASFAGPALGAFAGVGGFGNLFGGGQQNLAPFATGPHVP